MKLDDRLRTVLGVAVDGDPQNRAQAIVQLHLTPRLSGSDTGKAPVVAAAGAGKHASDLPQAHG